MDSGTRTPIDHLLAIVSAREYIFSENIGILGDLAAGKEQTFGTLSARSMAWIGGTHLDEERGSSTQNIINVDRDAILGLERFFQTKIGTDMGETDTRSRVLLSWDPAAY